MKRIAIVTHCIANNFGANLQALSTAYYLKNRQYEPVFITWGDYISNNTPSEQVKIHSTFLEKNGFIVSKPCHTDQDFLNVIDEYGIQNIIVGSDCVLTYKSPQNPYKLTRKGFIKEPIPKDYNFPNPFWLPYLKGRKDIKRFLLSASCGGGKMGRISSPIQKEMHDLISCFDYISVRDNFTYHFLHKMLPENIIKITPDPVFGFNHNFKEIPSKEELKKKFNLPDDYLVVSFYRPNWPDQKWANKLKEEAHKYNYSCVGVPMPQDGRNSSLDIDLELPLDPLDWYSLIKYSRGYIGNNMHPVIVAIHNGIPFYSYNIHGQSILRNRIQLLWTSKEYDLLKRLGLEKNVVPQPLMKWISPKSVIKNIIAYDRKKALEISSKMESDYIATMDEITSRFM